MPGFTVAAAAASIAVGLSMGAVATVGVTLAMEALEDHSITPQLQPNPSSPPLVQYGDRCYNGHCLPCDSVQGCVNKLPPLLPRF
jgi:Protein of unknown function (DUF2613)